MTEEDLKYIATVIFLANRGGVVTDHDIDVAEKVADVVYQKIFKRGKVWRNQ